MNTLLEKPAISKEDALKLLFETSYDQNSYDQEPKTDCFDRFGNYTYPTDYSVDKPNIAIGSSEGLHLLSLIDFENCK